jgi:hypothetical protein
MAFIIDAFTFRSVVPERVFIAVSSAPLVDIVGLLCGEQSLQVRGLVDRCSPVNCVAKIKAARRLRVRLGFRRGVSRIRVLTKEFAIWRPSNSLRTGMDCTLVVRHEN